MAARWTIPLDKVVAEQKEQLHLTVRRITFEAFSRVVKRSPVDTGRFRANWNVSFGTPDYTTTPSVAQGRGDLQAAEALKSPVGGVTYISNGLPYAQRLEYGWSKQAPAGMVRVTVAEFDGLVSGAVR